MAVIARGRFSVQLGAAIEPDRLLVDHIDNVHPHGNTADICIHLLCKVRVPVD